MFNSCCPGSSVARSSGKQPKSEIDKELEIAALHQRLRFKILLLGSGESGKSTFLKQLKLTHRITLSPQELKDYTYSLKRNAVESMLVLVDKAPEYGHLLEGELKAKAESLDKLGRTAADELITLEVADAITQLWKSDPIRRTYEHKSEFWILDAAEYYFDNVGRFVQDDFEPTEEDLVMVFPFLTCSTSPPF